MITWNWIGYLYGCAITGLLIAVVAVLRRRKYRTDHNHDGDRQREPESPDGGE